MRTKPAVGATVRRAIRVGLAPIQREGVLCSSPLFRLLCLVTIDSPALPFPSITLVFVISHIGSARFADR